MGSKIQRDVNEQGESSTPIKTEDVLPKRNGAIAVLMARRAPVLEQGDPMVSWFSAQFPYGISHREDTLVKQSDVPLKSFDAN